MLKRLTPPPPKRQIFMWNRVNTSLLKNHVSSEVEDFMTNNTTDTYIDDIWSNFKRIVATPMLLVPTKLTSTRFSQPWVTRTCKQHIRRKQRAYNRAKRTRSQNDWNIFKTLTKESRKECKRAYNNYTRDCIYPDLKNNPKRFFFFIKSRKCENIGVSSLRDNKGKVHTDDKGKANILNTQFTSVFSNDDAITPTMTSTRSRCMPEIKITINGVKKLPEKINPHKAWGPDMLSAKFLKEVATEISPALTLLFNVSILQSIIPTDWKEAFINPTYKKGKNNRGIADNYRPISLTSVTCKLLEHIIHSNIIKHLEANTILSDKQHGFRKRRGCETQLVMVVNDFAKKLNNSQQVDTILLAFSKAFDKVNHRKLLIKMDHYGIRGKLLDWMNDF